MDVPAGCSVGDDETEDHTCFGFKLSQGEGIWRRGVVPSTVTMTLGISRCSHPCIDEVTTTGKKGYQERCTNTG